MKIRNGFVTNSSSSSYVCEICLRSEGGYDLELSEASMKECENGHTICSSHINLYNMEYVSSVISYLYFKGKDENIRLKCGSLLPMKRQNLQKAVDLIEENLDIYKDYNIDPALCPICNRSFIPSKSIVTYLSEKLNLNISDIENEIRKEFFK